MDEVNMSTNLALAPICSVVCIRESPWKRIVAYFAVDSKEVKIGSLSKFSPHPHAQTSILEWRDGEDGEK